MSRELLERLDHGLKEVNDVLARLVARSVAGDIKRLSPNSLRVTNGRETSRVYKSVHRVLAQLRLDLIASSTAHHHLDRTASPRAQNSTWYLMGSN